MKKVGVAILGLGVVGGGTYKILTEHREDYQRTHKIDLVVENVLELRKERALSLGVEEGKIADNMEVICANPDVDIVIEVMGGVEPAKTFVLAALNAGKSVVTSNKELYCKYSHELEKAAIKNHCGLFGYRQRHDQLYLNKNVQRGRKLRGCFERGAEARLRRG